MNRSLRLATLRALKLCGRFLLSEAALFAAARLEVVPEPTLTECQDEWRRMEVEGLVVPGRNGMGDVSWKMTAAGQALANEMKL
jgi:hypothetical protein